MKIPIKRILIPLSLAPLALSTLIYQPSTSFAQNTAFTYQGRLNSSGASANGNFDLTFALFATNASGVAIAGPVTNTAVAVNNGLFTTTVDFGAGVFLGGSNWLEIAVGTNGANTFTTLSPRQQLTPTPYAIYATAAGGVNGLVIQQNTSGAPNVIGGASVNYVSSGVVGATIAGGGTTNYLGHSHTNSVTADFGTVSGGYNNTASGLYATVSGGDFNTAGNNYGTVGGGENNTALGNTATVGGGAENTANGVYATIEGGFGNQASGSSSFIGGGGYDGFTFAGNTNAGDASVIGGGFNNVIQPNVYVATVGGGKQNLIQSNAAFSTIGGGLGNQALSSFSTIGGGQNNVIQTNAGNSAIGGGVLNQISSAGSFIGGGGFDGTNFGGNLASGVASTIAGGLANANQANYASISGGRGNQVNAGASYSAIASGVSNQVSGIGSFIGGGGYDGLTFAGNTNAGNASVIGGGIGNTIKINKSWSTIGGGVFNIAGGNDATVGGGALNTAGGNSTTVSGGVGNTAIGVTAAVGGGDDNTASGDYATASGGVDNTASAIDATVSGGAGNTASGTGATAGGGGGNTASGANATVAGGDGNTASGDYATVSGGASNTASGKASFAAGQLAQANHQGAFVWSDSQNAPFASSANDQFLIRAQGGVGIGKNNPQSALDVNGTVTVTGLNANVINFPHWAITFGSGTTPAFELFNGLARMTVDYNGNVSALSFNPGSDRNSKEHFTSIDAREILDKVVALPISRWNYKAEPHVEHMGPMAQDFSAAFALGMDDKHIATVDADGVALAAIQGLNQKLNEKDAEIEQLKQSMAELKKMVRNMAENQKPVETK